MEILTHWAWWIAALILMLLELAAPAFFFLWVGAAAALTGLAVLLLPMGWQAQSVLFGVLALGLTWGGRKWFRRKTPASDLPLLNHRAEQMVGHVYDVAAAIENGEGRIRVGDGQWKATGPDCPVGAKVRVVAAHGNQVRVELAD